MTLSNSSKYIYGVIISVSLLIMPQLYLAGLSLFLLILLILSSVLVGIDLRKHRTKEELPQKAKKIWPIIILFAFVLFRFIVSFFNPYLASILNQEFYITLIISCILSWVSTDESKFDLRWMNIIVIAGGAGAFLTILYFLGIELIGNIFILVLQNSGSIAAYLVLVGTISTWQFCFHETRKEAVLGGGVSGICFFALLLNKNETSLWLMVLYLLAIICINRPRARMVKRAMLLFFCFVFLWCNMSMLTNYVSWVVWPVTYELEPSVYMELLLAVGGVAFFRIWDRIPEGKDLNRISMIGMQKHIRMLSWALTLCIIGVSVSANQLDGFVDSDIFWPFLELLIPVGREIQAGSSLFYTCLKELGVAMCVVLAIYLGLLGKSLYRNIHQDKRNSNMLFLLYLVFIVSFMLWDIPTNIIPVYLLLLGAGTMYKEPLILVKEKKMERREE